MFSVQNSKLRGDGFKSSLMIDRFNDEKFDDVRNNPALFWGIRHQYINIYFMGASIAKVEVKKGELDFSVAPKYLGRPGKRPCKLTSREWFENLVSLMGRAKEHQEKKNNEKIAQQRMILANNRSDSSAWHCFDMEYALPQKNKNVPKCGRFDILAASRTPMDDGRHKVRLIELKYGDDAYAGSAEKPVDFTKTLFEQNFGSGIVGHVIDFLHFTERGGTSERMLDEMRRILDVKQALGLPHPLNISEDASIDENFNIAIITLGCKDVNASRARMRRYLFASLAKSVGEFWLGQFPKYMK